MKTTNNRIVYIDALRVFSLFCIILIHSTAYINDIYRSNIYVTILGDLGRFSVTFFIFLSGLCLALRYKDSLLNFKKYIIHSSKKMLPAYIIWHFIYQNHYQGNINLELKSLLKNLLMGNVASHLYFVPVLLGLYLIFPIIWKFRDKILTLLVIAFVIQISSQIFRVYAISLGISFAKDARALFPLYAGYFVLGIYCALHINKFEYVVKKYSFLFASSTLISFILIMIFKNEIAYQLYYLTSIPTFFYAFHKISNHFYTKLATLGYYIYLIHHLILDYLVKYLHNTLVSPLIFSIFIALLTYGLCFACSTLYFTVKSKIKRSKLKLRTR